VTYGPAFPPRTSPQRPDLNLDQVSVLLVEADPGDALLVEKLVAESAVPFTVRRACSAADAIRELAAAAPQCVLVDLHLPDAQGVEVVARIVAAADEAAVVVLTGLDEEHTGLAAVAAGAQDYLVKGRVSADLLGRALRYAIQRKAAQQAAATLQASELRAQENARLERGLLPVPRLFDTSVQVCARYRPGRSQALLGGDFYDVVQTNDGTVHAVVGDVSGHGPDEAALGVCLRVAWRSLILAGERGPDLVALLEEILTAERSGPAIFATLTTLSRSAGAPALEVVRAGHPDVLLRASDGCVQLATVPSGPALGLLPGGGAWTTAPLPLEAGTAVVLFTDGLIEGRIGHGPRRLGEQGLLELAWNYAALPPDSFVDALIRSAETLAAGHGGLADDIALLHLHWDSHSVTGASTPSSSRGPVKPDSPSRGRKGEFAERRRSAAP
jgi:serine phosphatase RsbU (regulator of sigma subunit)